MFESRFDDWPEDSPINWEFCSRAVADEIVKRGRREVLHNELGMPGRGVARQWEQEVVIGWDPSAPAEFGRLETKKTKGPWPWICAVSVGGGGKSEQFYRNRHYRVPGTSTAPVDYKDHEIRKKCAAAAAGAPIRECEIMTPTNASAQGFLTGCPHGLCYTDEVLGQDACLSLPPAFGGATVTLKGLNFLSTKCKVQVRRVGGNTDFGRFPPYPYWADGPEWHSPDETILIYDIDCHEVAGDMRRPATVVSCLVEDRALFELPTTYDDQAAETSPDLPPGFYEVRLMVPNEDSFQFEAFSGGVKQVVTPEYLWSNPVFLDVKADPKINYQWAIESAFCARSTSGPGSDEPWISVNPLIIDRTTPTLPGMISPVYAVRAEEIDSGWNVPLLSNPYVIYSGPLAATVPEYSPIFVVASVLGLEVDSETAAKEQMQDSAGIFFEFVTMVASPTAAGIDTGYAPLAAAVGRTWAIGAIGIAVTGLLIGGLFYALWAPADEIIADFWMIDPITAAKLTTRGTHAQADVSYKSGSIHVTGSQRPFEPTTDATGRSRYELMYYSPEEGSRYSLVVRLARI